MNYKGGNIEIQFKSTIFIEYEKFTDSETDIKRELQQVISTEKDSCNKLPNFLDSLRT